MNTEIVNVLQNSNGIHSNESETSKDPHFLDAKYDFLRWKHLNFP